MAEITAQIDWVSLDDKRASARKLLETSADRVGIPELSRWLDEDPSTLRNQLAMRERRRPSAELQTLCFFLDPTFRAHLVGQCDEIIVPRRGALSEGEALRLIEAKALASWDRRAMADVEEVLSRVARESSWEAQARANGWKPPEER